MLAHCPLGRTRVGWGKNEKNRNERAHGSKTGRSLTNYCCGQNRLHLGKITSFTANYLKYLFTDSDIGKQKQNKRKQTLKHSGKNPFFLGSHSPQTSPRLLLLQVTLSPFSGATSSARQWLFSQSVMVSLCCSFLLTLHLQQWRFSMGCSPSGTSAQPQSTSSSSEASVPLLLVTPFSSFLSQECSLLP